MPVNASVWEDEISWPTQNVLLSPTTILQQRQTRTRVPHGFEYF